MDYEAKISAIWGTVVVFVIGFVFACISFQVKSNHDFDVTCIQNHKSVTYITLEGSDTALKVCK